MHKPLMNKFWKILNKSGLFSAHDHFFVTKYYILGVFKLYLFVIFTHTMFRSPRHLDFVYMYMIMFDMYLALERTKCEISIFAKYVILVK